MSSRPFESPNYGRRWRFTWESLAHIPILRLYLFNPEVGDTSAICLFLEASLRLDHSLLLVSWQLDDETTVRSGRSCLWIPVPRVLIDPGCPVDVKAMGDHIEAKLVLLLPVDHPVEAELWGASGMDADIHLPLSLGYDIDKFSSEGVNIFCKSCSTKLTRQPLRKFVEIPSMNWQEVADNWFGGCCSFGGVSEKLVSKYLETFDCKEGTCLLDRASIAVCEHDLEGAVLERSTSDFGMKSFESNDTSSMICDLVSSRALSDTEAHEVDLSSIVYSNQLGLVGTQNDINMDCLKPNLNNFSLHNEKTFSEPTGERTSKCDFHCCITEKVQTSDHANRRTESEASTAACNGQQSIKVYGSSFMVSPANLSNDVECVEFSCRHCLSPLGSYSCTKGTTAPVVGGIRLFKCYVSTSIPAGAPDDAFKKYTLENIFTKLLIEGARDELSFRTVVCDLRTKFPMLQIVLLNSRAWCYSGFCYENTATRGLPAIHIQPVIKVLFSDCSTSTQANSIITKDRLARTGTEEVYMMNREIEELRRSLKSSIDKLPHSCSSLQGMSLSFLGRWDSGTNLGEFDGHSKRVLSCDFKPTRPFRIVTCGEDFILNFYEGPPFKFKHSHRDHSNFINCVRYSPDGSKFISVSSDKKGIIFDGKSGDTIGELSTQEVHKGSIYAVSWSPNSKKVLTVSADKTAKVWDIMDDGNGKLNCTLACPSSGGVDDMQVGCLWHGDYLVTVSLGGMICIFSASDPEKPPISFSGHMKSINTLSYLLQSGQGTILTTSYDGIIVRWVPGIGYGGKIHRKENTQIKCFSATEGELLTSGYDNKVHRLPLNEGLCGEAESVDVGSQPNNLHFILKCPELALVSTDSGIVLLRGTEVASRVNLGCAVTASAVSPDGSEAIVGSQDGKLHIYAIESDMLKEAAVLEKHRGAITVIQYSPDASMFASADANREAVVWDRALREVKLKNMVYHTARINCLAWSPDSRLVATGSLDSCVIVYDVEKSASSRTTIKGAHMGGVYGLAFSDQNSIVSAGEDACVRVWRLVR